jgi:hemoglobin
VSERQDLLSRPFNRRGFLKKTGGVAVFFGAFTLVGCGDDDDDDSTATATATTTAAATGSASATSLYERLGGEEAISAVVTEFLTIVGGDDRINTFFANTNLDRLNTLLVEQIGQASGGPQMYSGRDMKTAHAGLEITEDDFNALVEDLVMALDKFEVPEMEKSELLGLLGPMQGDIVTA